MPYFSEISEYVPLAQGHAPVLALKLYNLFAVTTQATPISLQENANKRIFTYKILHPCEKILEEGYWNNQFLSEYFEDHGALGLASLLVISLFLGQQEISELGVRNNIFIFCGSFAKAFCGMGKTPVACSFAITAHDLRTLPQVADYRVPGWLDGHRLQGLTSFLLPDTHEDYSELSVNAEFLQEKYLTLLKIIITPIEVLEQLVRATMKDSKLTTSLSKLLIDRQQLIKTESLKLEGFVKFAKEYMYARSAEQKGLTDLVTKIHRAHGIPNALTRQTLTELLERRLRTLAFNALAKEPLFGPSTKIIKQQLQTMIETAETASRAQALAELLSDTAYYSARSKAQVQYEHLQYANSGMFYSPVTKPPAELKKKKVLESIELDDARSFHRHHRFA